MTHEDYWEKMDALGLELKNLRVERWRLTNRPHEFPSSTNIDQVLLRVTERINEINRECLTLAGAQSDHTSKKSSSRSYCRTADHRPTRSRNAENLCHTLSVPLATARCCPINRARRATFPAPTALDGEC